MSKKVTMVTVNPDRIIYVANKFDIHRCHLLDAITDLVIKDISDKKYRRSTLKYCQEQAGWMHKYFNQLQQLLELGEEESDEEE